MSYIENMKIHKTDLYKAELKLLSSAVRELHAALINDAKADYFKDDPEATVSPLEMLKIISDDPHFEWLRSLSYFLIRLDEARISREPIEAEDVSAFTESLEKLIGPAPAQNIDFRQQYIDALHRDPKVATSHGQVKMALLALATAQKQ
ncbi:MAG: hypothetical protein CVV11_08060 [Gammaproteobacteria bacterium HGW-Gammaproteobacteria-15]|nr:MAG: hypothetical protein CVV11_08060 [Gammaproteobacteria bacterium HGW-Gammaproteobacteria-15]